MCRYHRYFKWFCIVRNSEVLLLRQCDNPFSILSTGLWIVKLKLMYMDVIMCRLVHAQRGGKTRTWKYF